MECREGGLEPEHPERRRLEGNVLLLRRVRGVVGRDRRDRAVAHRLHSAARSVSVRSGGFIFRFASSVRTASSVRQR